MPYTIKPGSFKYKNSNGQFSEIDCFEGPDLTEEVAALEKNKAPIIIDSAVGNPIVLKDGADNLPIEDMKIHFAPKQDLHGYDNPWPAGGGKNLLSYPYGFTTDTKNSCTATVASDGTVSFSGTPTSASTWNIKLRTSSTGDSALFLPEGNYILNGCPSGGGADTYQISVIDSSGTTIAVNRSSEASFSIPSGGMNVGVQLYINANVNPSGKTFMPMIRQSSISDGMFAPYSNICSISGWTVVNAWRTGKNLIKTDKHVITSTTVTIDGESNDDFPTSLKAGTYTISFKRVNDAAFGVFMKESHDEGTTTILSGTSSATSKTFTISADGNYRFWIYRSAGVVPEAIDDIMLELGSTASQYTPYIGQSYPVMFPALGKNLFDVHKSRAYNQNVSLTFNDDGSMTCVNNNSYAVIPTDSAIIAVPSGTYTMSSGSAVNSNIAIYASDDGVTYSWYANGLSPTVLNRTIAIDKPYVQIRWQVSGNTTATLPPIQLEVGSTATTYETYTNTVYGGALDTVTGMLTAKWGIERVLTGSDNGIASGKQQLAHKVSNKKPGLNNFISNLFVKAANANYSMTGRNATNVVEFRIELTDLGLTGEESSDVRLDAFEAWLIENPTYICYELAEPIEIQLDPLSVQTLLGDNTIWSDANGDIELDYRADTKLFCQKNDTVDDVQINGTSIVQNGVANVPVADASNLGIVKVKEANGVKINSNNELEIYYPTDSVVKAGTNNYRPIVPASQHKSVFYGLAKLAGSDMASSANTVGVYTDDAKSKISDMLNAPVSISGTTPSITGKSGLRYICGECATLSIVAPESGCIDVTFKSGSTPTVLTVSSAKTGVSAIKWANGFNQSSLEADTTYELNILDGEFGVVGEWT